MKLRAITATAAALALTTTPVLAQANQAESAEVSRSVEKANSKSELEGGTGIIVAIIAAAGIIGGIIIAADNDDDDAPTSP
ncbi:MAG: hypothetical protein AAFX04_09265 [Pseudomonadota bacterium]